METVEHQYPSPPSPSDASSNLKDEKYDPESHNISDEFKRPPY